MSGQKYKLNARFHNNDSQANHFRQFRTNAYKDNNFKEFRNNSHCGDYNTHNSLRTNYRYKNSKEFQNNPGNYANRFSRNNNSRASVKILNSEVSQQQLLFREYQQIEQY